MKFYSGLLAIALTAPSTMPSLASFSNNLSQKMVASEQITLSAEKANPAPHPEPDPVPFRGAGRR